MVEQRFVLCAVWTLHDVVPIVEIRSETERQ